MNSVHKAPRHLLQVSLLVIGIVAALWVARQIVKNRSGRQALSRSNVAGQSSVAIPDLASDASVAKAGGQVQQSWDDRIAIAGKGGFASLFLAIMEIGDPNERTRITAVLVKRWIEQDLQGFIAFIDAAEVDQIARGKLWDFLGPALAEVLPRLDDKTASNPVLKGLIARLIAYWAATDPRKALAWAQQWLPEDSLDAALAKIAPELARTSPAEAFRVLEAIHPAVRRVEAINGIGAVLGTSDSAQALRWASALANPAERPYAMGSVLAAMAAAHPERAAQEFNGFRNQMGADYAAQVEADRAILARNPANEVEGDLGNFEVRPSPTNPQLHLLNDAGVAIAEAWAAADPAAALGWIETLPEGRLKRDALENALASWAAEDGPEAFAFYHAKAAVNPEMAEVLFRAWATADPSAASLSAESVENRSIQVNAVSGVVHGWMEGGGDLATIERWIDGLPRGLARDAANAEVVEAVSLDQPYQAWERAREIENAARRKEAMESAFSAILASDPGTAQQVLDAARLVKGEVSGFQRMVDAAVKPRK